MDDRQDYDQNADYDFFVEQLPVLLDEHQGQVALIRQRRIVGYFDSMQDAVDAGIKQFGPERFIAQEILAEDATPIAYSLAY